MSFRKFEKLMGRVYMDAAGDEGGKAGGAGGEDDKGGNADDNDTSGDKGGKDDKGAGDDNDDGNDDNDGDADDKSKSSKLSDREATLLKENLRRKEKTKTLESELKDTKKALEKFNGVDLDKVSKLLADAQAAETQKLEDKGEWNKLKAQMVEQHVAEVDGYKNQVSDVEAMLKSSQATVDKLTIGHEFDSSAFINDEMTLTPGKARVIYGQHFDIVDGSTVAFDKPRDAEGRVQLINGEGNPLGFNDAIKKIVDADPDRDSIIRSKMKPGSDSTESSGKSKPKVETKLTGRDRIAAGLGKIGK